MRSSERRLLQDIAEDEVSRIVPDDVPFDFEVWTPELVRDALKWAVRKAQYVTGRVGPKAYGSGMPVYMHTEAEIFAAQIFMDEESRETAAADRNRIRLPLSTVAIGRLEDALVWQTRYLAAPDRVPYAEALRLWLRSKATRAKFGPLCRKAGISQRTVEWRRDRALSLISQGLTADGVAVWRED